MSKERMRNQYESSSLLKAGNVFARCELVVPNTTNFFDLITKQVTCPY